MRILILPCLLLLATNGCGDDDSEGRTTSTSTSTGGATATGGTTATGGATATGGVTASGGFTATGGTLSAGGTSVPNPDCATVLCAQPDCETGTSPQVPAGECCPICVPNEGSGGDCSGAFNCLCGTPVCDNGQWRCEGGCGQ